MSAWSDLERLFEGPRTNPNKVDWQKSFKSATKGQSYYDKQAHQVPKAPKAPKPSPLGKPARPGGPDDDPFKASTNAEVFSTDVGNGGETVDYIMYRTQDGNKNGLYVVICVPHNGSKKARHMGEFSSRQQAIDAVLHDHDKNMAGIGEQIEED